MIDSGVISKKLKMEVERARKEVEAKPNYYLRMLVEALKRNSVEVILSENPSETAKNFGQAFVCFASSAAADTGVVFFTGSDEKLASSLAEHHVAIIGRKVVMPDILSAYKLALLEEKEVFASSSASKTADIEGKLVWGMHGPRRFTVILEGG